MQLHGGVGYTAEYDGQPYDPELAGDWKMYDQNGTWKRDEVCVNIVDKTYGYVENGVTYTGSYLLLHCQLSPLPGLRER